MAKIYESHLSRLVREAAINDLIEDIVAQLNAGSPIELDPEYVSLVNDAYRQEMIRAESELHTLVTILMGMFWQNQDIITTLNIKGECPHANHKDPVTLEEVLDRGNILTLKKLDEELTFSYAGQCEKHPKYQILPLNSHLEYRPERVEKGKGTVRKITSRIKNSEVDLSKKLADKILNVDDKVRPDRIRTENPLFLDLYGIRLITPNEDTCHEALERIRKRKFIEFFQIKDYIRNKKPNGYQALHAYIGYNRLLYELQIRSLKMHAHAERSLAGHKHYFSRKMAVRRELGETWNNLQQTLAQVLRVENGLH